MWWLSSCEGGSIWTRKGDEILVANEGAGFWAADEEDVGTASEARGKELVSDDSFSLS
jgi:hypothetical protein